MRTKIKWAELHAPLFLGGTNLGQKLDHKVKGGVSMEYDEEKRHLYVTFNAHTARIPETSVLSMVEGEHKVVEIKQPAPSGKPIQAQVSSPHDHVFRGAGEGQTGVGTKVK
jgi:hypothetical protein